MRRGSGWWVGLLALGLSACTPAPQPPLVVGTVPWVGSEPFFLARELKLYPSESIHLVEYTSSEQLVRAFRNGALDAAAVSLEEILNLDLLEQRPRVVLVLDSSHGADCLVARREVESLAGLRGKRVATENSLLSSFVLHRALERGGIPPDAVQRVFSTLEAQVEAWTHGEVSAVVTFEPYCRRLVELGGHVLFDSSRMPGEIVDVLVVREQYLQQNPGQVDALLRGWFAALAHFRIHPLEDARRMAPRLRLEPRQFLEALEGIRYVGKAGQRELLTGEAPKLLGNLDQLGGMMRQQRLLPEVKGGRHLIDASPLLRVSP